MIVRHAYFNGTVEPSQRVEFNRYFDEVLLPLIAAYPRSRGVKILRPHASQDANAQAASVYQIVETTYDTEDDLALALRSKERERLYKAQQQILSLFNGEITHVNYEFTQSV